MRELAQEGVEYVGRGSAPPRARTVRPGPQRTPEPHSPQRGAFRPRVAALAEPLELSFVAAERAAELPRIREDLGDCTRCPLCEQRRSMVSTRIQHILRR